MLVLPVEPAWASIGLVFPLFAGGSLHHAIATGATHRWPVEVKLHIAVVLAAGERCLTATCTACMAPPCSRCHPKAFPHGYHARTPPAHTGVKYSHGEGVMLRDVKCANVLLSLPLPLYEAAGHVLACPVPAVHCDLGTAKFVYDAGRTARRGRWLLEHTLRAWAWLCDHDYRRRGAVWRWARSVCSLLAH